MLIFSKYLQHKQTLYNFFWRSLQILGEQGTNSIILLLCAKLLTPYEFGVYTYILAIIFLLTTFGDFGISTATSKYVSEYNIKDKDKLKASLYNAGLVIVAAAFILIVISFVLGPLYLKDKYSDFLYLLPLVFLIPITSLYDGIYRGLKKFGSLTLISLSSAALSLGLVYFLVKNYGLIGALIAQNVYYILIFILLAIGYRELHLKINLGVMKEIGTYSLVVGLGEVGFLAYMKIDSLVLGHFNLFVQVGYLEIATRVFAILVVPFSILGQVLSPSVVKRFISSDKNTLRKDMLWQAGGIFLISILGGMILYFAYPLVLSYFLPKYFNIASLQIFSLLLLIFPLSAVSAFISQGYLFATGNAKYNLLMIPFGILNIFLDYVFVIWFGFIGVVYSTIICTTLNRLIMWVLLYRALNDQGVPRTSS